MNCQDNSRLKVPLPEACRIADIGCVPISNGKPKCPPEPDQLPLAYDPNSKTIWIFDCDSRDWNAYTRFSLSELGEVSLDNFRDVCNMLKVPVFYNPGTGTVEGHMTLADFGDKLKECLNLPGTDSKTVVKAGDNVNVTSSTAGSTTTYTVSATGGGDEDSKTVIEAGDNITLTSNKSGATTTYRISSTGAGPGDSKTVLTEGTNIKLTKTESGATTTYKIDCTADGSDGNDVTVVEAGSNVNVASSKSGNTTTYTVSATGGGPSDSKTILQGKDGGNVTVTSTTSGATTTYTLDSKDSKSVVKAGSGISVASSTSGDTTTYTVTNTGGGGGGTPVSITGGTGIEVDKTSSGGVDNYTIKSTVPTVTVTAGNNVTINKTTSTDGSTVDYKINSSGGGSGGDSNTVVEEGKNLIVTSSSSAGTITYTINDKGIIYFGKQLSYLINGTFTINNPSVYQVDTSSFIVGSGNASLNPISGDVRTRRLTTAINPFNSYALLVLYYHIISTTDNVLSFMVSACNTDLNDQVVNYSNLSRLTEPSYTPTVLERELQWVSKYLHPNRIVGSDGVVTNRDMCTLTYLRRMRPWESVTNYLHSWILFPEAGVYSCGLSFAVEAILFPYFRTGSLNFDPSGLEHTIIHPSAWVWDSNNWDPINDPPDEHPR